MLEVAGVSTVADIVRRHGAARPDRTAIHFERQKITSIGCSVSEKTQKTMQRLSLKRHSILMCLKK